MPLFKTVIAMRTFHEVVVEADSVDDVPDAINDLDSAISVDELYDRSSWDIDDLDNIQEIGENNG